MGAERDIYFLSKNYVTDDCTINLSSNAALKTRLYDQLYALQWESSGETSEAGYTTYAEVLFYEGALAVNRTIDTLVLQNINLKDFKIQYYTGGAYADIPGSEAAFTTNADTSKRIKLSATITTDRLKILMKATITPGEEKKIGEFWALLETYRLVNPYTSRTRSDDTLSGFQRMADGTGFAWYLYDKWRKTYQLNDLTDAQLASLYAIFAEHDAFTFYENYTRDIDLIKLVYWVGNFSGADDPKRSKELNTVTMTLAER